MRNMKSLALTAALVLTGAAFAASSTASTYDTANTTAAGTFGDAVAFTIPSTSFSIDASQLETGRSYTPAAEAWHTSATGAAPPPRPARGPPPP